MLQQFIAELVRYESTPSTFNPWSDFDEYYDLKPVAPQIRQNQLQAYLSCRISQAKYFFLAEAVGYQGAKFSGVPLVSERILLGHQKDIGPENILPKFEATRTSKASSAPSKAVEQFGYAEPTATIMWGLIQKLAISPLEIILWNSFPFHPFKVEQGSLSNRTPKSDELAIGRKYLDLILGLCPPDIQVIAVGEKAAATLGDGALKVRHPANGGATLFREQLLRLVI